MRDNINAKGIYLAYVAIIGMRLHIRSLVMYKRTYKSAHANERERVIQEFLPVIRHMAFKFQRGFENENEIDDLMSAGILGLLEAMDKYDAGKGTRLNTFAYTRVRGAMLDELRKRDWFPRSARTKSKKLEAVTKGLETRLGRYPTEEEVAQELKIDLEEYLNLLKDVGNLSVLSIDEISQYSGMDKENIISFIMDDGADPERSAELSEIENILATEINRLPEKQKMVLSLYYYEDMNMREIAEVLGITEARISQIHSQALLSLRTHVKRLLRR